MYQITSMLTLDPTEVFQALNPNKVPWCQLQRLLTDTCQSCKLCKKRIIFSETRFTKKYRFHQKFSDSPPRYLPIFKQLRMQARRS